MKRFWTYPWGDWKSYPSWPWYSHWLPGRGSDEFGRTTVVLPIPFKAHLVVALWNSCDWRGHDWDPFNPSFCERCGISDDLEAV